MDEGIVYLNGNFIPESEARVSVLDRGFNSGDGVYDVTRTFGHKPFKLREHVERLYRSLHYTRIECGLSSDEMEGLSLEVLGRNKSFLGRDDDFAIWQVISRGVTQAGIAGKSGAGATVAIYCLPVDFEAFARSYLEGVMLITPSTRRIPPQCLEAKAKITNKMNHSIALAEARQVDPRCTPLMLDIDGNIAETNMANFFFVADGALCTPTDKNVLGGVTRSSLMALAGELGIEVEEGNYTPYDVYNAQEAFTSGTSSTLSPVKSLNGVAIGTGVPGPVTLRLIEAWNEMVGLDIVDQALGHLAERDKQQLLGSWAKLKAA